MELAEATEIYKKIKCQPTRYNEEIHCPMILKIMADKKVGTYSAFCVKVIIDEKTFYNWLDRHELFLQCYALGKMYCRENWEEEGRELRTEIMMPGQTSYKFEYWRMIGWMRFGIGKSSKVRLKLKPESNPNEHYKQLITQAADGDFTTSEIKQLMEAINVGLSAHQVFKLQEEIEQLKKDLITMNENSRGDNKGTVK